MSRGTLVDATLIAAPSSTTNLEHARAPEMHQVKKGNECYFGMKAHVGVDRDSGLLHTLVTTSANISDRGLRDRDHSHDLICNNIFTDISERSKTMEKKTGSANFASISFAINSMNNPDRGKTFWTNR